MASMNQAPQESDTPTLGHMRSRGVLSFVIFGLFFVFYIGAAVLQTPALKAIASLYCLGMPLGLLLSLAIFPVSWILIIIYFLKSR